MAVTLQQVFVANKTLVKSADAVNGATQGPSFQLNNEWPVGDYTVDHINLDFYGNLNCATGGGAVNPDGLYQSLRSIQFATVVHGNIVENVDGILLCDMLTIRNRMRPTSIDAANTIKGGTPKFESYLRLPFGDPEAYNLKDTVLDVLRAGKPTLTIFLGAYNPDYVVGGASGDGLQNLSLEVDQMMDPGPVAGTDIPNEFMPFLGKFAWPVVATGTQVRIDLSFGSTVFKRVLICQREGTNGIRRPNDIIGVSQTDRITLKVNSNIIYRDRISWAALQRKNEYDYKLAAMPVGVAVFDFFAYVLGGMDLGGPKGVTSPQIGGAAGAKIADALNTATSQQGSIECDADVTFGNSASPYLVFGYDGVKLLPPQAKRVAAAPAAPAKV